MGLLVLVATVLIGGACDIAAPPIRFALARHRNRSPYMLVQPKISPIVSCQQRIRRRNAILSKEDPTVSKVLATRAEETASAGLASPRDLWVDGSEALGGYSLRAFAGLLGGAALTGALTGLGVATFKASVEAVASALYGEPAVQFGMAASDAAILPWYTFVLPGAGGLAVAALRAACGPAGLGPNLAGHVAEATSGARPRPLASVGRTAAAVATLGSGCSLGPEGPAVEWGMFTSRCVEQLLEAPVLGVDSGVSQNLRFRRQLLAAGAASGVAAGFNAPLAGIVFALEVVSDNVVTVARKAAESEAADAAGQPVPRSAADASAAAELDVKGKASLSMITIASLVSALVVDFTLGQELALRPAAMLPTPALEELPVYLMLCVGLGAASGFVALTLARGSKFVAGVFAGGDDNTAPGLLAPMPLWLRPAAGGFFCGALGLAFPEVLFFGYSTLDAILAGPSTLRQGGVEPAVAAEALTLLVAKLAATAICLGSGLVGGTFAPSLFLGAVLGVAFHGAAASGLDAAIGVLQQLGAADLATYLPHLSAADRSSFASIGAAATLAAVFRAPLTASLLIFELTRGYELVLPLLAAAGTGPLVAITFDAAAKRSSAEAAARRGEADAGRA